VSFRACNWLSAVASAAVGSAEAGEDAGAFVAPEAADEVAGARRVTDAELTELTMFNVLARHWLRRRAAPRFGAVGGGAGDVFGAMV
jgi:hypothetical protein